MKAIIDKASEIKETIMSAFVPKEVSEERFNICKSCEEFNDLTRTCKKCGCFMPTKTTIAKAKCPIGKWQQMA